MILCNCDCQFGFSIVFFQYSHDSEVFKLQDYKKLYQKDTRQLVYVVFGCIISFRNIVSSAMIIISVKMFNISCFYCPAWTNRKITEKNSFSGMIMSLTVAPSRLLYLLEWVATWWFVQRDSIFKCLLSARVALQIMDYSSIPFREIGSISSHFIVQKPGIWVLPDMTFGSNTDFTYTCQHKII